MGSTVAQTEGLYSPILAGKESGKSVEGDFVVKEHDKHHSEILDTTKHVSEVDL